jgi:hypothetical protein
LETKKKEAEQKKSLQERMERRLVRRIFISFFFISKNGLNSELIDTFIFFLFIKESIG